MSWWDAVPAIAGAVGAGLGHEAAAPDRARALQLSEDAYNRALQLLASGQLEYTPELAQAIAQGPSAMQGVQADPMAVQAQRDALAKMAQASEEGYGVVDKAAVNATMNEVNANERSAREAALRGLAPGSGASILGRLKAQQGAANRANQAGLDIAANSRKHALQALAGYGNLAGRVREQSFGERADIAQAQDAISRFNAANSNLTNQFNANARNQAKQQGVGNRLGALQLAGQAGQQYGQGLYGQAGRNEQYTQGMTEGLGNALYQVGKDDEDD